MLRRGVQRAAACVVRQRQDKRFFAQAAKAAAGAACPAKHEHDEGRTFARSVYGCEGVAVIGLTGGCC